MLYSIIFPFKLPLSF